MKLVYTHENKIIVEMAKGIIAEKGIESFIRNEFSSSGLGELSAIDTWPELWVLDDSKVEIAKKIISKLSKPSELNSWVCVGCNEENEPEFEICWNCQADAS